MRMAKLRNQRNVSTKSSKNVSSGNHRIVGTLPDGVAILAPKSKPKHFTLKEIRSTIQELRRNSATGFAIGVGAKRG